MTEFDYASAADVYNELGVLIDALGGMVRDGRLSVDRDTDRDLASTVQAALDHVYEAREACSHLETDQSPVSQAMLLIGSRRAPAGELRRGRERQVAGDVAIRVVSPSRGQVLTMSESVATPADRGHQHLERLTDLPLIREDLLLEIERRHRAGASPAELVALRPEYDELLRRR